MTEFCPNCGKPVTGRETDSGHFCPNCAAGPGGGSSSPDRGLRPGSGWNPPRQLGPIGSIGSGTGPPGAGPFLNHPEERSGGESDNWSGPRTPAPDFSQPYTERSPQYTHGWPSLEQPEPESYDPDRPPWGVGMAIVVWVASVSAIIMIPAAAILFWLAIKGLRGAPVADRSYLQRLFESPQAALIAVGSTIIAHLITLAIVWAVATGWGRRPALEVLGWRWTGMSRAGKCGFVIAVVTLMFGADFLFNILLPQSRETDFERLLNAGQSVRIVIALLAVFTAPLVEEAVYRGVLYSGLRRALSEWPAVLIVTALFAGVHLQQYWGAWGGIAGIAVLSFTLTLIRAKTKSIMPCIAVHMAFNAIGSVGILFHH